MRELEVDEEDFPAFPPFPLPELVLATPPLVDIEVKLLGRTDVDLEETEAAKPTSPLGTAFPALTTFELAKDEKELDNLDELANDESPTLLPNPVLVELEVVEVIGARLLKLAAKLANPVGLFEVDSRLELWDVVIP